MTVKILEIVKGNTATLIHAKDGALWYEVIYPKVEGGSVVRARFNFQVPFEDVQGGTFMATEKALHLMRWIRRQIADNEEAKNGTKDNSDP